MFLNSLNTHTNAQELYFHMRWTYQLKKILIKFEGKAQKNTFFNILSTSIYTTKNPSEFFSNGLWYKL